MAHEPPLHSRISNHLSFEPPEDKQEKALRLYKERLNFYVKDIGTWLLASFFLLGIALYTFLVLVRADFLPVDKDRAWSALTAILSALVGFRLGKATK